MRYTTGFGRHHLGAALRGARNPATMQRKRQDRRDAAERLSPEERHGPERAGPAERKWRCCKSSQPEVSGYKQN